MSHHHGSRIFGALLVFGVVACSGTEDARVASKSDSAQVAMNAATSEETGGMQGMPGMAGMTDASGVMESAGTGLPDEIRSHMASMRTATAGTTQAMLPKHRQLVANMIARMNGEMRDMQMASDAAWSATVDSLRTDLVRLPELSGAELTSALPAHLARVERLGAMHGKMMGSMAK